MQTNMYKYNKELLLPQLLVSAVEQTETNYGTTPPNARQLSFMYG